MTDSDPNGFSAPIKNKKVAERLKQITNDYDLLCYVKNNITFFIESQLVNAEWFAKFDPGILEILHIYTSGYPCVEAREKDFNAVVIDCNLDLKTYNDVAVNIRFFGKSYGSLFINAKSQANIKAMGLTTIELYASDHSQSNLRLLGKSRCFVEAHKESFVVIKNLSLGRLEVHKGETNIIII